MEPVDPTEAPDYYKVIKEPMGTKVLFLLNNYKVCKLNNKTDLKKNLLK